jgi:thiamine pyrophosphate-dependent acetolactate synthase large subunit-like protein
MGAIDANHSLALGLIARNGTYPANHAARQADVLLALGVRFDDRTSSSWLPGYSFNIPPTKLIHVDIDPDEIARNYPVALGLMADVGTFLAQLHEELDIRKAQSPAARAAVRRHRALAQRMGRMDGARLPRRYHADPSPTRGARNRQGPPRRCDFGERRGCAS